MSQRDVLAPGGRPEDDEGRAIPADTSPACARGDGYRCSVGSSRAPLRASLEGGWRLRVPIRDRTAADRILTTGPRDDSSNAQNASKDSAAASIFGARRGAHGGWGSGMAAIGAGNWSGDPHRIFDTHPKRRRAGGVRNGQRGGSAGSSRRGGACHETRGRRAVRRGVPHGRRRRRTRWAASADAFKRSGGRAPTTGPRWTSRAAEPRGACVAANDGENRALGRRRRHDFNNRPASCSARWSWRRPHAGKPQPRISRRAPRGGRASCEIHRPATRLFARGSRSQPKVMDRRAFVRDVDRMLRR